ncbi:hypothetical protein ACFVU0_34935 [Streptomyces sp. NPDC058122]|uniref:hypothetical protein n=1 Tax=Streptomyces sp. NPDC058122 TaxID=3346349 RepID=UPI0036EAE538
MNEAVDAAGREALWDRVGSSLEVAASILASGGLSDALVDFRDFLSRNELELAFDELVAIGDEQECTTEFWMILDSSARSMRLYSAALNVPHLTSADLCRRHVAAHAEALGG